MRIHHIITSALLLSSFSSAIAITAHLPAHLRHPSKQMRMQFYSCYDGKGVLQFSSFTIKLLKSGNLSIKEEYNTPKSQQTILERQNDTYFRSNPKQAYRAEWRTDSEQTGVYTFQKGKKVLVLACRVNEEP